MAELQANRTLVKSPPELWSELSDPAALARRLGAFGEIRITRVEPEREIDWEGERVSGTVRLEPAGWGTRVMLTACDPVVAEPSVEPETAAERAGTDGPAAPSDEPTSDFPPQRAERADPEVQQQPVAQPIRSDPVAPPAPVGPRALLRLRWAPLTARLRARWASRPKPCVLEGEAPAAADTPVTHAEVLAADPDAVVAEAADAGADPKPVVGDVPAAAAELETAAESATDDRLAILTGLLDDLGAAHHRPFSRS